MQPAQCLEFKRWTRNQILSNIQGLSILAWSIFFAYVWQVVFSIESKPKGCRRISKLNPLHEEIQSNKNFNNFLLHKLYMLCWVVTDWGPDILVILVKYIPAYIAHEWVIIKYAYSSDVCEVPAESTKSVISLSHSISNMIAEDKPNIKSYL